MIKFAPKRHRFSWNMYGRGNPVSNNDPSGHFACGTDDARCYNAHGKFQDPISGEWSWQGDAQFSDEAILSLVMADAGITFVGGNWSWEEKVLVAQGAVAFANKISGFNNITGPSMLDDLMPGDTTLYRASGSPDGVAAHVGLGEFNFLITDPANPLLDTVFFYDNFFTSGGASLSTAWITGRSVHEMAHVMDFNASNNLSSDLWVNGRVPGYNAGAYANTNQIEYYAEVVGLWVYGAPFADEIGAVGPLRPLTNAFLQNQLGIR